MILWSRCASVFILLQQHEYLLDVVMMCGLWFPLLSWMNRDVLWKKIFFFACESIGHLLPAKKVIRRQLFCYFWKTDPER